ncbi:MAG: GNAT family N-acetyltransferase [Pyrinomonadaceae bacterium]
MESPEIKIREVEALEELDVCLDLQREVFNYPDLEVSPTRHLVVTKHAGGFTLGAFDGPRLVGFVLTVPAFRGDERIYYSHMTCVSGRYQGAGIGARLKWAQRDRALEEGVKFIKWTFQPVQARNAFFNLEKLGAVIRRYLPNFYGTDFFGVVDRVPIDSDRLFAEWELGSEKVSAFARGEKFAESGEIRRRVAIPPDWNALLKTDPRAAADGQRRIKEKFRSALAEGFICRGFQRDAIRPEFLFFDPD